MSEQKWIYYAPVFECDRYNAEMLVHSPWAGHRFFGYDYVCNVKPSVIVELGSYYGCSSFAFLQAIKDMDLNTAFYAVDTWCGDSFTKTDYQEDIYGAYKQINDACFGAQNSRMLRKTFDEACADFADTSIDLLHIDGSHTYEDVKNDFTHWKNKVSAQGVVFFHDVGKDLLFGKPMGSHLFWLEIQEQYPWTLEFPFSNGLGLLFFSEENYLRFRKLVNPDHYQQLLNLQDTENKDLIRKNFFELRSQKLHIAHLQEQLVELNSHLERYRREREDIGNYQRQLEEQLKEHNSRTAEFLETKESYIRKLEQQLAELNNFVQEKVFYIQELEAQIAHLNDFSSSKESYIQELESQIGQLNHFAASKEDHIRRLENQLTQLNDFAVSKESYIQELEAQLAELNNFVASKEAYIQLLQDQALEQSVFLSSKEEYIRQLENQVSGLNVFAASKEDFICQLQREAREHAVFLDSKENYIRLLESQAAENRLFLAGKEEYICQLEQHVAELHDAVASRDVHIRDLEQQAAQLRIECQRDQEDLLELTRRLEKLPFGRSLLRNLPSHNLHQEDQ